LLSEIENPVVLVSHGGYGAIFDACYFKVEEGIVFEKDSKKTAVLVKQRPTWAVYESDCVSGIAAGLGKELPITILDCDPYGEPWPVIDAVFQSEREFQPRMGIVVNDGLKQKLKTQTAWNVRSMEGLVSRYGNAAIFSNYLQFCQLLIEEKAAKVGYTLRRWTGYYCGSHKDLTHYAAILERSGSSRR